MATFWLPGKHLKFLAHVTSFPLSRIFPIICVYIFPNRGLPNSFTILTRVVFPQSFGARKASFGTSVYQIRIRRDLRSPMEQFQIAVYSRKIRTPGDGFRRSFLKHRPNKLAITPNRRRSYHFANPTLLGGGNSIPDTSSSKGEICTERGKDAFAGSRKMTILPSGH